MSHSNRHQFQPLNKDSKPLTGQRLIRLIAKKDSKGNYASPNLTESVCVSVPVIGITEYTEELLVRLAPHIDGLVQDAQAWLVRDRRIDSGCTEIGDDEIGLEACLQRLDAEAAGTRLSKEYLDAWFVESYSEAAVAFIAHGMRFDANALTPDQEKIVESKCNVLRDMFSGFASGRYSPPVPVCKVIEKFAASVVDVADSRMIAFATKASEIRTAKEAELSMDALGLNSL